ncbi:hypothetical protein ANCCAN_25258 [Ancylostoma caninum]|uniref:MADF domain-containing protein n=1 Tax=Ancylostoma caninum TaxID=29170 RepID=A0A368F9Z2_ANCCA|nr:hypothetical protein ANCCAN_25258 [Ancylostoma caninum]
MDDLSDYEEDRLSIAEDSSPVESPRWSVKREPRVAEVWINELREALIDEDAHGKDLDWIRITSKFNADHSTNFDAQSLKKQWKNLRDSFFKKKGAIANATTGSGAGATTEKCRFFKPLMFLLRDSDQGVRLSNVDRSCCKQGGNEAFEEPGQLRVITKVCETLDELKRRKERDEFDVFGEHVAVTLRGMASKDEMLAKTLKVELTSVMVDYERQLIS